MNRRAIGFVLSFSLAAALLVFGIFHDEMGEVMFNACMLCLSCIGMG